MTAEVAGGGAYEIASDGCARTFADLIGDKERQKILQKTLDEEALPDKKLTKMALAEINISANAQARNSASCVSPLTVAQESKPSLNDR